MLVYYIFLLILVLVDIVYMFWDDGTESNNTMRVIGKITHFIITATFTAAVIGSIISML